MPDLADKPDNLLRHPQLIEAIARNERWGTQERQRWDGLRERLLSVPAGELEEFDLYPVPRLDDGTEWDDPQAIVFVPRQTLQLVSRTNMPIYVALQELVFRVTGS